MTEENVRLSNAAIVEIRRQTRIAMIPAGIGLTVVTLVLTVAAFIAGWVVNDVGRKSAYADALGKYTDQMIATTEKTATATASAETAAKAAEDAKNSALAASSESQKSLEIVQNTISQIDLLKSDVLHLRDEIVAERGKLLKQLEQGGVVKEVTDLLAADNTFRASVLASADTRFDEIDQQLSVVTSTRQKIDEFERGHQSLSEAQTAVAAELAALKSGERSFGKLSLASDNGGAVTIRTVQAKLFFESDNPTQPEGGWKITFNSVLNEPSGRISFYHQKLPTGFTKAYGTIVPQ